MQDRDDRIAFERFGIQGRFRRWLYICPAALVFGVAMRFMPFFSPNGPGHGVSALHVAIGQAVVIGLGVLGWMAVGVVRGRKLARLWAGPLAYAVVMAITLPVLLLPRQTGWIVMFKNIMLGVGAVGLLSLFALAVWVVATRKTQDARIDQYMARKAAQRAR